MNLKHGLRDEKFAKNWVLLCVQSDREYLNNNSHVTRPTQIKQALKLAVYEIFK